VVTVMPHVVRRGVVLHLRRLHLRLGRLVAGQHCVGDAAVVVEVAVVQVEAEVGEAGQGTDRARDRAGGRGRSAQVNRRAEIKF
jgi:hypothetical protein